MLVVQNALGMIETHIWNAIILFMVNFYFNDIHGLPAMLHLYAYVELDF